MPTVPALHDIDPAKTADDAKPILEALIPTARVKPAIRLEDLIANVLQSMLRRGA